MTTRNGLRPLDLPRRELGVVGGHRAGADDHRVRQRAHAVHVAQVLFAGHELRVTGVRGDEAVEALPEMADGDRVGGGAGANRQVEIDKRRLGRCRRQRAAPAGAGHPAHAGFAVAVSHPLQDLAVEREADRRVEALDFGRVCRQGAQQRPRLVGVAGHPGRRRRGSLVKHRCCDYSGVVPLTARGVSGGAAPRAAMRPDRKARRPRISNNIRGRSNEARRDAAPDECRHHFHHGLLSSGAGR